MKTFLSGGKLYEMMKEDTRKYISNGIKKHRKKRREESEKRKNEENFLKLSLKIMRFFISISIWILIHNKYIKLANERN